MQVGATNVGRIRLSFTDMYSNKKNREPEKIVFQTPVCINKGNEVGYFELGSTLILALENDYLANMSRELNSAIMLGETLNQAVSI